MAAGATDDCFACKRSKAACDRRRPYCTQCIQLDKECSGYKTTLTWGLGVASRGKLRGLSLPVARKRSASSATSAVHTASHSSSHELDTSHHEPRACPGVPFAPAPDDCPLSSSTGFSGSRSDSDCTSSTDFPPTPDDISFLDPFTADCCHLSRETGICGLNAPGYNDPSQHYWPSPMHDLGPTVTSTPSRLDLLDATSRAFSDCEIPEGTYLARMTGERVGEPSPSLSPPDVDLINPPFFGPLPLESTMAQNTPDCEPRSDDVMTLPRPLLRANNLDATPRMQSLLNYYSHIICPVLVAFDGPSNPYRTNVMHLALRSESLRHAIAALAMNNIRMRRNTVGQSSKRLTLARSFRDTSAVHSDSPTPEEMYYRSTSVGLLNTQLTDPTLVKDDSVLATLLILCLFHVCDSGFTSLKTQLVGVQKLLSMREGRRQSGFLGWIEMCFTWFDVMSSTVNDRETEIRGDSLEMTDLTADLGAMEHYSGCDGRLFKLIARLGRLNLLSQNRPVKPKPTPVPRSGKDYYSLDCGDDVDPFGWCTELFGLVSPVAPPSAKPEFWSEWHDIRTRLQRWEIGFAQPHPAPLSSAPPTNASPAQRDLVHISESFRYAALLYTERLAHPSLPPSALNLQNLVGQALYHINQIGTTSCVNKFLLWPLFITGTECSNDAHRDMVRTRCVEIQRESGFFNNLSGLHLLEKVWRRDDSDRSTAATAAAPATCATQAFRWRKAMDKVDGEYILI